jgi:hypothetical protein
LADGLSLKEEEEKKKQQQTKAVILPGRGDCGGWEANCLRVPAPTKIILYDRPHGRRGRGMLKDLYRLTAPTGSSPPSD